MRTRLARKHGISEATLHSSKAKYGDRAGLASVAVD